MKQFIKKVIPKSILCIAVDIRDKIRLGQVPIHSFNLEHLKQANDLNLTDIFSDQATEKSWERDHKGINSVFGDHFTFGGINPGDRRAIYYLITALKPKKVLEIGTHIGASTLYIACALKNVPSFAKVITVDILDVNQDRAPWKKLGLAMSPRDYAQKLDCLAHISFKVFPALDFMKNADETFDLIFLDGDHSSQAVYKEVSRALTLLNPGGVILLHDYYPDTKPLFSNGVIIPGPFRAINRIYKENKNIEVQPLGNLPWPTKLGSNVTSLAVITRN